MIANKRDESSKITQDVFSNLCFIPRIPKWLQASPYIEGEITILKPWASMVFAKPLDVICHIIL